MIDRVADLPRVTIHESSRPGDRWRNGTVGFVEEVVGDRSHVLVLNTKLTGRLPYPVYIADSVLTSDTKPA